MSSSCFYNVNIHPFLVRTLCVCGWAVKVCRLLWNSCSVRIQYELIASVLCVCVCSPVKAYFDEMLFYSIFFIFHFPWFRLSLLLLDVDSKLGGRKEPDWTCHGSMDVEFNIHKLSSIRFVISRGLRHAEYLDNRIWHDSGTSTSLVRLCLSSSQVRDIQSRMHHQR